MPPLASRRRIDMRMHSDVPSIQQRLDISEFRNYTCILEIVGLPLWIPWYVPDAENASRYVARMPQQGLQTNVSAPELL